jgi:hypothetical protein
MQLLWPSKYCTSQRHDCGVLHALLCPARWPANLLAGLLAGCQAGWLPVWLAAWLAGWLAGWQCCSAGLKHLEAAQGNGRPWSVTTMLGKEEHRVLQCVKLLLCDRVD